MSDDAEVTGKKDLTTQLTDVIVRQGFLGVLLVALMYFIWDSANKKRADDALMRPIIERNTEALGKSSAVSDRAAAILERLDRANN